MQMLLKGCYYAPRSKSSLQTFYDHHHELADHYEIQTFYDHHHELADHYEISISQMTMDLLPFTLIFSSPTNF